MMWVDWVLSKFLLILHFPLCLVFLFSLFENMKRRFLFSVHLPLKSLVISARLKRFTHRPQRQHPFLFIISFSSEVLCLFSRDQLENDQYLSPPICTSIMFHSLQPKQRWSPAIARHIPPIGWNLSANTNSRSK